MIQHCRRSLVQPGLFDRRALNSAESAAETIAEIERDARVHSISELDLQSIAVSRIRLAFVLRLTT